MTTSWAGASPGSWGPRAWGSGRGGDPGQAVLEGPGCSGPCAATPRDGGQTRVFILPLRAQDHFILYCEGRAGRTADPRGLRLLVKVFVPAPQSPSCPLSLCLLLQEARGSSRSHVAARCPWGPLRAGCQRQCWGGPGRSPGSSLWHHPWLRSSGVPSVGEPEWEGEIPAPGASLRGRGSGRHWRRQDLPARGQEVPRVTEGPCGQEQSGASAQGLAWTPSLGRPSILRAFAEGNSYPAEAGCVGAPCPRDSWADLFPAWLSAWPRVCGSSPLARAAAHSLARGSHPRPGPRWPLLVVPFTPLSILLVSPTGRNPERGATAWENSRSLQSQKLNLKIFRPLQSGEKPTEALAAGWCP